jgi:hypothetical protein
MKNNILKFIQELCNEDYSYSFSNVYCNQTTLEDSNKIEYIFKMKNDDLFHFIEIENKEIKMDDVTKKYYKLWERKEKIKSIQDLNQK